MSDRLEVQRRFLSQTPFFGGLDDGALEKLQGALLERRLSRGAVVYAERDEGRSMYVVESGSVVMCCAGGHGREVKLSRLGPGDFFGETTLIEMQPRPSTAKVERDAVLLELTNVALYRLYKDDVRAYVMILQNINRELCRRLRKSEHRITELADESGDDSTQIGRLPRR